MKPSMLSILRLIAQRHGIDPDAALGMTLLDFARAVNVRQQLRDSERIAVAAMVRARAVTA
jgi:hypothetical protein